MYMDVLQKLHILHEPRREKTCLRGLWPGKTHTGLLSHSR